MVEGGELLRRARQMRGLTQGDLAARAGTSQEQVSRWESGRRSPTVMQLSRLLAVMGFELTLREVVATESKPQDSNENDVRAALSRRRRPPDAEPPDWRTDGG
jgi:transcriptional regulator with XRE-family HTH domain